MRPRLSIRWKVFGAIILALSVLATLIWDDMQLDATLKKAAAPVSERAK